MCTYLSNIYELIGRGEGAKGSIGFELAKIFFHPLTEENQGKKERSHAYCLWNAHADQDLAHLVPTLLSAFKMVS